MVCPPCFPPYSTGLGAQEEYIKGVSAWDFDVAKLKAQAAMEPDDDGDGWNFDAAPAKEEAPPAAASAEDAPEGLRRNPSVEVPKDSASPSAGPSPSGPKDAGAGNVTPSPAPKGPREAQQMVRLPPLVATAALSHQQPYKISCALYSSSSHTG